jgi:starch synthase
MSDKKRVLIVTQEMEPYAALSEIAAIARKLPQYAQDKGGMEVRVLMPRYGTINERRHRLHEVVRLSGMNIIVDDDDYPLIIKVASLPGARMQVYFLDNDDFFKRKSVFEDANGKPFADNAERMVFFCKGVIETVKKFGWPPDFIHCHGWMTALMPLYLRTAYRNEPLFERSKIIYSCYDNSLEASFSDAFLTKAAINNLSKEDLAAYHDGETITLQNGAIHHSDAVIRGTEEMSEGVEALLQASEKPVLDFQSPEDYLPNYLAFYDSLVEEEESVEG